MRHLLRAERIKLTHSLFIKIAMLVILLIVFLSAIHTVYTVKSISVYEAPFLAPYTMGSFTILLLSILVSVSGGMEFACKTLKNPIGRGIGRGKLYLAKALSLMGLGVFLFCMIIFFFSLVIFFWKKGFDTISGINVLYLVKFCVFLLSLTLQIGVYVSFFQLLLYIVRNRIAGTALCIVSVLLEMYLGQYAMQKGWKLFAYVPQRMIWTTYFDFVKTDRLLSIDFLQLNVPSLFLIGIFLAVGVYVMEKEDISF